jgi:surfeit locus 1 family protein
VSVRLGSVEFRPPALFITLLTLLLLSLLMGLGFWQLDRAAQKRALLEQYQGMEREAPIEVRADLVADEELEYRPAQVRGRFDTGHQFLLDNRTHQGVAGYHVFTPLRIDGSEQGILVNRGWVPRGPSRSVLPDVPTPATPVQLEGMLKQPTRTITLGEGEDREPGWPKVLQRVRLDLQARQLGYPLLPMLLLLGSDQEHGFVREWEPVKGFGPEQNMGYAVQWFGLATALLVIYIVVNCRRSGKQ